MRTKAETKRLDREASGNWKWRTTALGCRVCPALGQVCEGMNVNAHHIIRQQVLKRYVAAVAHEQYLDDDARADLERELLWALPNGLAACERAHRRHHNRIQPIPLDVLPLGALAFAARLNLSYVIEREYPVRERMAV